MVDSNDKFLPNFINFICSILAIAAITTIFLYVILGIMTNRKNSSYAINEINIFQIPLENLVTSDTFGKNFNLDNSIHNVIEKLSKENDIDEKIIKDMLTDERLNIYAYKDLYSSISNSLYGNNYFINNSSANSMVQKIVSEYELKNKITFPSKMENQLTTIMTSYIRELSNLAWISTEGTNINMFYSTYTILISILVLIASCLVLAIINKNKILTLKRCGAFGLFIGLIALIYAIIQKGVFWIFQTYFDRYSYTISGVGNIMFTTIFNCSLALILISLLFILFAENILAFDRDLPQLFKSKKKLVKRKKKKIKKKKKKNSKKKSTLKKVKQKISKNIKKIKKNLHKTYNTTKKSTKQVYLKVKSFIIKIYNSIKKSLNIKKRFK